MTTSTLPVTSTNEMTQADLMVALENLRQKMVADYHTDGCSLKYDVEFEIGSKYTRIVKINNGGSRSCGGFVVTTKKHKEFQFGDLLKSASWKAPATNFTRGNVFDLEDKKTHWTGIM